MCNKDIVEGLRFGMSIIVVVIVKRFLEFGVVCVLYMVCSVLVLFCLGLLIGNGILYMFGF